MVRHLWQRTKKSGNNGPRTTDFNQSRPESNQNRWLHLGNQSPRVTWHAGRNNSLDVAFWKQLSTRQSERSRTNNSGTPSKGVTTNSATDTTNSIPAHYNSVAQERLCGSMRSLPVIRPVSGQYQGTTSRRTTPELKSSIRWKTSYVAAGRSWSNTAHIWEQASAA